MAGLYVATLAVALVQYVRTRERRLLLLMAWLALVAAGYARGLASRWADVFHVCAALAALGLVFLLAPRPLRRP
jgi:hypothetical protein